jgi:predicted dehydrogenase
VGDFAKVPGHRFIAICDVHDTRLGQTRELVGGESIRTYGDYRKLLEDKDIDAVIIATPGHWHALQTIHACQAGKDVYVEKPLASSIGEGRATVEAARKYERMVQIGTQQRSWEHYRVAAELVQAGRLGEISEVKAWDYDYFYPGFGSPPNSEPPPQLDWELWLGPAPKVPFNPNRFAHHYWFFDYGGAWQVDWAVHHYDIVNWCLGVTAPIAAVAMGGPMCFDDSNTQWPDTFSGILEYGPGPVAKKGFLLQYTFRAGCRREHRSHGKCFFGTEASMILDRSGFTITPERGKGNEESFRGAGPHHQAVFLDSVRSRTRSLADVEQGHYASLPGHLLNIAWRVGRKIHWDAAREQVIGDPQANALVTKQYRSPWKLEI